MAVGSAQHGIGDLIKLERLGEGTYGTVFKVRNKKTGDLSAMKQIKLQGEDEGIPSSAVREISLLKSISHTNIIRIKHIIPADGKLYLLFELMSQDLRQYMTQRIAAGESFSFEAVKQYAFQIFQGINYCHKRRIFHRDLKPQNILLDDQGGLKLGDFGLARLFGTPISFPSFEISTLWYRAPEILLEFKNYGPGVDIWSVGCIITELIKEEPMFKGSDGRSQLKEIFRVLGTPRESSWPGVSQSTVYQELSYTVEQETSIEQEVPCQDSVLLDLMKQLFIFYPKSRPSAEAALGHPYFADIMSHRTSS